MSRIDIKLDSHPTRRCGECQACCKLLPMKEGREEWDTITGTRWARGFHKPANTKCPHQKFGVGCKIYRQRPLCCRTFVCRWLTGQDTDDQHRPDRSHCVIDPMPDALWMEDNDTKQRTSIQVIQIWVDPKHRYAYRDEPMRSYIERQGKLGIASLIRWDSSAGLVVFPASITGTEWMERGGISEQERTPEDALRELAASARLVPP